MKLSKKLLISIILILLIFFINSFCISKGVFAAQTIIKDYTKLDDKQYPGVKAAIDELKEAYPNYNFIIYDTDLEWDDVITMEYQGHYNSPRNLVEPTDNKTGMWICPICTETAYDSGRWRCASIEAIEYMMDPRNSLDINSLFQFEILGGDGSNNATRQDIASAVKGTFLDTPSIIDTIYSCCKTEGDPSKQYYNIANYLYDYKLYKEMYADLRNAFKDDEQAYRQHWINNGIKEGRIASMVFDATYYINNNEEVKKLCGNDYEKAYNHFLSTGIYEHLKSSVIFDAGYYLDKYDDLYSAFNNNGALALMHFVDSGLNEERMASGEFQLSVYKKQSDLYKAFNNNNKLYVMHFLTIGKKENRIWCLDENKTVTPNPNRKPIKVEQGNTDDDMNPLYLVSLILQEQGRNGSTLSLGNGYKGQYVGYYNLLNIGAYGAGQDKVILNGLKRAADEGWTSPDISIREGISFLKQSYIDRGQNTLYTQKFDVVGDKLSDLFQHQYQQNVMAAENEGRKLKSFYESSDSLESSHTFIIPVYNNMPKDAATRPDVTNANTTQYEEATINVNSTISVRSRPVSSSYVVGSLSKGETVKILKRATEKVEGLYRDIVVSNKGYYGYVVREEDGKTYLQAGKKGATTSSEVGKASETTNTVPTTTTTPTTTTASTNTVTNDTAAESVKDSDKEPELKPINNITKKIDITDYLYDYGVYKELYADLRKAFGDNASLYKEHWLTMGIKEGRVASLVFDPKFYVNNYEDLKKAFGNNYQALYNHFISFGINEGRKGSKVFDPKHYLLSYEDLQKAFGSYSYSYGLMHFVQSGCNENRITSNDFSVIAYKKNNEDLQKAFGNNIKSYYMHYIVFGYKENRVTK